MDIRDFITDIKEHRDNVKMLEERILRLRSAMEITVKQLSDMPHAKSAIKDKLAEDIAKLDELERKLVDETICLEENIQLAELEIETLPEKEKKIVRLRYVDCLHWKDVAEKVNYCESHCYRLHTDALEKLKDESK